METIGHPILKDSRTSLRTLDELLRLVELRLEEVERRISLIEARAREEGLDAGQHTIPTPLEGRIS